MSGRPDPPVNLKIHRLSETSSTVGWEPGYDGGKRQSFRVNSRRTTRDFLEDGWVDCGVSERTYVFAGEPYTLYEVAVYAVNEHGSSQRATLSVRLLRE